MDGTNVSFLATLHDVELMEATVFEGSGLQCFPGGGNVGNKVSYIPLSRILPIHTLAAFLTGKV